MGGRGGGGEAEVVLSGTFSLAGKRNAEQPLGPSRELGRGHGAAHAA